MRILGINLSHDSSACVMENGVIRSAIALERLVGIQRGAIPLVEVPRQMANLIDYCLGAARLTFDNIDYFIGSTTETSSDAEERLILRDIGYFPREKIMSLPHPSHHLAHACASFFSSGFVSAPALVIDAYGSRTSKGRESESAFWFEPGQEPRTLFRLERSGSRIAGTLSRGHLTVPDRLFGIGEMYRLVTLLLGFRQSGTYYDDAGKTMGLAAYGERLSSEPVFIRVTDGGLDYDGALEFLEAHNLVSDCDGQKVLNARQPGVPLSSFHASLASQIQWEFEEACLHLVRRIVHETGAKQLALGGGAFLNSVLNHRILRETRVEELFVFPAATDDGNSVGAASYVWQRLGPTHATSRRQRLKSVYFGRGYGGDEIAREIESFQLPYEPLRDEYEAAERAAALLAEGKVVGWFQGGAELGPRALGNRSILANPTHASIKEHLNSTVKFREPFRPYGASVVEEMAERFFDLRGADSPFMLLVCEVLAHARHLIGGVTHADGTCRVQTVSKDENAFFHHLIAAFGSRTGVPVVLNTSLNVRGMPIAETPSDALACFTSTHMDAMFIGPFYIPAPKFDSYVPVLPHGTAGVEGLPGRRHAAEAEPGVAVRALLASIDGKKTLGELLERADPEHRISPTQVLALYRKGAFYWKHLGRPKAPIRATRHFSVVADELDRGSSTPQP